MKVTVKLFASLREGRFDVEVFDLPVGATIAAAIDRAAVPRAEVTVIFVNSRAAEPDRVLAEGDILALVPAVGGG